MNPIAKARGLSLAPAYPSNQIWIRRRDLWLHHGQPAPGSYPQCQCQVATRLPGGGYDYVFEHFMQDSRVGPRFRSAFACNLVSSVGKVRKVRHPTTSTSASISYAGSNRIHLARQACAFEPALPEMKV